MCMLRGKKPKPGSMTESMLQRKENAATIAGKVKGKLISSTTLLGAVGTNEHWRRQRLYWH